MQIYYRTLIVVCLATLQFGCATIFSGSKEEIRIDSNPSGATVIVLGGAMASLIKYGVKSRELVRIFAGSLSEADRNFLETHDVESLLTWIVLDVRGRAASHESSSAKVAEVLAKLPKSLKEAVLEKFGLKEFATAPVNTELSRGTGYAVIGWQPGSKIRLEVIESKFNWVTLWNVLNLGLGVPIDMYTGAWMKLTPTELKLNLMKLADGADEPRPISLKTR